ncbi:MAG TPA: hypothetical protein VD993_15680 [Chitinophagaceae bacterium]|nr:hypothetical protein [Chitinophagaceae bacterium]
MNETLYNILFVAGRDAFDNTAAVTDLVNKVFSNPLASFETMDLKGKYVFKDSADALKVVATLQKKGQQSIQLRATTPHKLVAILKKNDLNCTVYFTFSSAFVGANISDASLKEYLTSVWFALPSRQYGAASDDTQYGDTLSQAGILQVIGIFDFNVNWLHWLSQPAYSEWYKKENLQGAPFYKIEELSDGSLLLQSYPHPGDYRNTETLEKIKSIEQYLNTNKQQ